VFCNYIEKNKQSIFFLFKYKVRIRFQSKKAKGQNKHDPECILNKTTITQHRKREQIFSAYERGSCNRTDI